MNQNKNRQLRNEIKLNLNQSNVYNEKYLNSENDKTKEQKIDENNNNTQNN